MIDRQALTQALPLRYWTVPDWAPAVLGNIPALLNDHAHLEKKAAQNAMDMLTRWPCNPPPKAWISSMMAIVKDEIDHLIQVNRLMEQRGHRLSKHHRNPYAAALNSCVRLGQGRQEHIDRLMVSALIEARSCERFLLLAEATDDSKLKLFYESLWASEKGHFQIFLDMAYEVCSQKEVDSRWSWFLDQEAEIIVQQDPGSRVHSNLGVI